jgi:hypothetical protein
LDLNRKARTTGGCSQENLSWLTFN